MEARIVYQGGNEVGESPFWDEAEQALYWVDIIGKSVNRLIVPTQEFCQWSFNELVCGIVPMEDDQLCVALSHELRQLDKVTGQSRGLLQLESERPGNRINEMKCDPRGRLWVGTMQNNVNDDGSGRPITCDSGALYCIEGLESVTCLQDGLGISNTLAWHPSTQCFYFADSTKDIIWKYHFDSDTGAILAQRNFFVGAELGAPDGSAIDEDGCLWNARFGAGCVVRLDGEGNILDKIDLPVNNPTSCCFGGQDNATLFVTSARFGLSQEQLGNNTEGAIIAIDTNTRGLGATPWRVA